MKAGTLVSLLGGPLVFLVTLTILTNVRVGKLQRKLDAFVSLKEARLDMAEEAIADMDEEIRPWLQRSQEELRLTPEEIEQWRERIATMERLGNDIKNPESKAESDDAIAKVKAEFDEKLKKALAAQKFAEALK